MTFETVQDFKKTDKIVLFGINTGFEQVDAAVGLGSPLIAFFSLVLLEAPLVAIVPVTLFVGTLSLTIVLLTPSYMNIAEYGGAIKYNIKRQGAVANTETETIPEVNESSFERVKIEETTRGLSKVDQFYPQANVIARDDGCYVAGLRIEPPNRDFDTLDEYIHVASQIREQVNNTVDFQFQFYVTTRPFPIETYMSELESRLDDKDIQDRDIMSNLITELVERRPEELEERGTKLPHYYLFTYADPAEISIDKQGTTSPIERLATVPYLGAIAEIIASIRDDAEDLEKENRLVGKVQDQVAQLDSTVVQVTEDISSEVVTVVEWAELLRTYWNGDSGGEPDNIVRQQPAVRGTADIPGVTADISTDKSLDKPAVEAVPLEDAINTELTASGD